MNDRINLIGKTIYVEACYIISGDIEDARAFDNICKELSLIVTDFEWVKGGYKVKLLVSESCIKKWINFAHK